MELATLRQYKTTSSLPLRNYTECLQRDVRASESVDSANRHMKEWQWSCHDGRQRPLGCFVVLFLVHIGPICRAVHGARQRRDQIWR